MGTALLGRNELVHGQPGDMGTIVDDTPGSEADYVVGRQYRWFCINGQRGNAFDGLYGLDQALPMIAGSQDLGVVTVLGVRGRIVTVRLDSKCGRVSRG